MTDPRRLSRRDFLAGTAVVGAAAVAGGVVGGAGVLAANATADRRPTVGVPGYIPFEGAHQRGVTDPARPQTAAIFVALDAVVDSKAELPTAMAELTARSRALTGGLAPDPGDTLYPPPESGIVGPTVGPSDLTITVGFGASLFDRRFGLADRRPTQLVRMPVFPNDRLDADLTHGDLLLQICATDEASCIHALRYLMLGTRSSLVIRWLIHGFQQRPGGAIEAGGTPATRRNLLGFKDGTANPSTADASLDGPARLGGRRPGRARLDGRWDVHGGPHHPDVRGALGSHRARRAGGDHRPDEADRSAAGQGARGGRPGLRRAMPPATGSRSTRTSGWPTRGPPETQTQPSSCAAGTRTAAGSTAPGSSTRGCSSSHSRRTSSGGSSPSSSGSPANRWRSTSSRSVAATSSCRLASRARTTSSAGRSCADAPDPWNMTCDSQRSGPDPDRVWRSAGT